MKAKTTRRLFIKKSTALSCTLLVSGKLLAFSFPEDQIPNPKEINYCGYKCPENCQFLEASVKNDTELKKKAYDTWKIKERYGVDFDEKTTFCFGCKNEEKPAGVVMTNCTVRSCAIEKKLDSCIQCNKLETCNKDLWSRFPDFHKTVIKMRKVYCENKA